MQLLNHIHTNYNYILHLSFKISAFKLYVDRSGESSVLHISYGFIEGKMYEVAVSCHSCLYVHKTAKYYKHTFLAVGIHVNLRTEKC